MADTVVFTEAGLKEKQKYGLTRARKMDLYVNNVVPTTTKVAADFTKPTYAGYVAQDMASADWSDPVINGSGRAQSQHDDVVFSYTSAPNTVIYGQIITSVDTGDVLMIISFENPVTISGDGSHTEQQIVQDYQ